MATATRMKVITTVWLEILPVLMFFTGCESSKAVDENFDMLSRVKKDLRTRYGEHLSLHQTNAILDTTLDTKTLPEIDAQVAEADAGEWHGIAWEELRPHVVEILCEHLEITPDETFPGVECAVWDLDPPRIGWTDTCSFPVSVKGSKTVWDKAVLLFKDEKLLQVLYVSTE